MRLRRLAAVVTLIACATGPLAACTSSSTGGGEAGIAVVTALPSDAPRAALALELIQAINSGNRSKAMATLDPSTISVSDCDHATATAITATGTKAVEQWLSRLIDDHTRFTVESIENANTDPATAAVGVVFSRRSSDTLTKLGLPSGVRPRLAAKVRFVGTGANLRIEAFANGPVGGDAKEFCRVA